MTIAKAKSEPAESTSFEDMSRAESPEYRDGPEADFWPVSMGVRLVSIGQLTKAIFHQLRNWLSPTGCQQSGRTAVARAHDELHTV